MGYDIVSLVPTYCDVFLGRADVEGGLAFPERIERRALDYSLESLHAVDRYLDYLHEHADEIEDQKYTNTILAAGCYLGEVFRRCASATYRWVNYADYFRHHPELAEMIPEGVGTGAVLVGPADKMTMPLNKIARYIGEGPENNTHFYAAADASPEHVRREHKTQEGGRTPSGFPEIIVDAGHNQVGSETTNEAEHYRVSPAPGLILNSSQYSFVSPWDDGTHPNAVYLIRGADIYTQPFDPTTTHHELSATTLTVKSGHPFKGLAAGDHIAIGIGIVADDNGEEVFRPFWMGGVSVTGTTGRARGKRWWQFWK